MSASIVMSEYGDSSVLKHQETPVPTPGAGQILVKMVATGVNFIDIYRRQGIYPVALPHTPGTEGMGIVEALGAGVTTLAVGQRVAFADGIATYADFALVPAGRALLVPDGMDDATAAALPLQGLTAHYLATSTFPLAPGHTALVHAGAGGVGLLLIQLAKARGARVFTTVSSPEKAELALAAGADEVLSYDDFDGAARTLTDGHGVDVVYDGVGISTFDRSLKALSVRGMMVLFGAASGPVPDFDLQRLNAGGSLFITRPTLSDYVRTPDELAFRWNELTRLVGDGQLTVRVGGTYPLSHAAQAQDDLAARTTTGKLLLLSGS
ncbi:NADPH2:quinone reductase [Aurantimicrobium minutum]|uniref:quinone oxidoreductase family protein n=1 Tax=Aurantimicrobium minutum TaxID=708131 RepID=UPI0024746DF2|nr:quinone oxidoreductase [Aurantimicrobium minutum]MDH6531934.1 NADPH2:quinone reductase [Aurantimicrobium minutum]